MNTLTRTDELIKEINERQRLEREVIEAAKQWRAGSWPASKVSDAIDALADFESKNTK